MSDQENELYPIRTVGVYRHKSETVYRFVERIRRYGEIETPIYSHANSYLSFVTFTSENAARSALQSSLCMAADEWLEPKFIDSHRRTQWPIIESLNEVDFISQVKDECLVRIFSFLNFDDLLTVSKVNRRFRNIVKKFMISTTKTCFIVDAESWKRVEAFLQTFGSFVTTLALWSGRNTTTTLKLRSGRKITSTENFYKELLKTIPKYCSNEYLRSLQLYNINVNEFPIRTYREARVLLNLNKLKISRAPTNEKIINEILKLCPSLKAIKIGSSKELHGQFLENVPKNIERVTIEALVKESYFKKFLSRCSHLKQLSCCVKKTELISQIVGYQPQLPKLKLCCLGKDVPNFSIDEHVRSIRDLKQLKYFKLQSSFVKGVQLIQIMSEMKTLEELIIETMHSTGDAFLPAISKMNGLKTLKMCTLRSSGDTSAEWTRLFASLSVTHPHLEHLDIGADLAKYIALTLNHSILKMLVLSYCAPPMVYINMNYFRMMVEIREKSEQNFPLIIKTAIDYELRHFLIMCDKYDHLIRIVDH